MPGPSTSIDDIDIKIETSRPPSSSHTSLSEEAYSPQYFSEEEEEEEESDQEEPVDSDLELN